MSKTKNPSTIQLNGTIYYHEDIYMKLRKRVATSSRQGDSWVATFEKIEGVTGKFDATKVKVC